MNFFTAAFFFGGDISRLIFLTALLGSWPVGGLGFKV